MPAPGPPPVGLRSSDLAQYRPAGATDLDIRLACKGLAGDSCGALNRLCTASETVRACACAWRIESFTMPLQFGLFVPPFAEMAEPSRVVELAKSAEAAGWDGFFLWDHILAVPGMPVADSWITMAAVAQATARMRLGMLVTPLAR